MREWLEKFKPTPWLSKKLLLAGVLIAVGAGAFCWGRHYAAAKSAQSAVEQAVNAATPDGQGTRVVGYYYNQPIFREELGEFLIARFGAERLDFLINRKIVEAECRKYGITVTDADVEYRFQYDLKTFGGSGPALTEAQFANDFLRRFNKTIYEWKEDVIRPKLMMEKLVRATIKIGDQDVREGFEARYGPKVECRMIVLPKDHLKVNEVWAKVRTSRDAFIEEAKSQAIPKLAADKGKVPPIHMHFGDKELERVAFRLKEGEISNPIHMEDGSSVIMLCEKHIPKNETVRYENEWQKIAKEMEDLRVAQRVPEVFKQLHDAAAPQNFLKTEPRPMPKLTPPAGQPTVQMPANAPLPAPGIAAPVSSSVK